MVPTQDELLSFLNSYMNKHEGHLWDRHHLVDAARNHFRTTTPAVSSRLNSLHAAGMIRQVEVGNTGMIFWDGEEKSLIDCFLIEPGDRYTYSQFTSGPVVTYADKVSSRNLWANGTRAFFISVDGYTNLVAALRKITEEREAAAKAKMRDARKKRRSAIKEIVPDGIDLLLRLREAATTEHLSTVELREFHRRDIDGGNDLYGVAIDLYGAEDLTYLFDVLRRGFKSLDDENASN